MGLVFRRRGSLLRLAEAATTTTASCRAGYPRDSGRRDHAPDVAPVPAPSDGTPTAELERLARLHTSDALTDSELIAATAKLLGT